VDDAAIREWIQAGRLQPSDNVWKEGMAEWKPASQVPELADAFASPQRVANPPAAQQQQQPSPADITGVYDAPGGSSISTRPSEPHRGGTILTLGIIGVVCCGICAVIAWVMGSGDMKKINAGVMDPSGKGLTQAGMILGIIGTILWIIGMVVNFGSLAANL
jgi:hypothetical protein